MGGRSLVSLFCLASLYCSVIASNVLQHQEINYRGLLAKQTTDKFGLTLREVTEGDRVTQQLYSEAAGRVLACETVHNATAGGLPVSTAGVQAPAVLPQEFAWLNLTSVREDCRLAQAVHTREKRSATRRRTRHGRNKLNKIRKGRKKDRLAKGRKGTMEEIFIVPGTKWCGPRNVARRYSDMGPAWEADRCCRVHDQCQRSIMALSKGFNNVNYQPFTVSHCSCDRRFRTCLKMADTTASNFVGKLFFNLMQTKCFVLKTERICVQRNWWGKCQKTELQKLAHIRSNMAF